MAARELQGVPAGGVHLARVAMSWPADVGFPTNSLCEHLPRSSPVLPAMWFALQIAKFKKNPNKPGFETSWVQSRWEVWDE